MHPRLQARGDSRAQDDPRLVDVECALVAEHVDPAGKRSAGVKHLARHQLDVALSVIAVFGGHHMRTEKRGFTGELVSNGQ